MTKNPIIAGLRLVAFDVDGVFTDGRFYLYDEGVETLEQLRFLQKEGCNYAQGHLFGDPVSSDEYLRILVEQERGESRHTGFFN